MAEDLGTRLGYRYEHSDYYYHGLYLKYHSLANTCSIIFPPQCTNIGTVTPDRRPLLPAFAAQA